MAKVSVASDTIFFLFLLPGHPSGSTLENDFGQVKLPVACRNPRFCIHAEDTPWRPRGLIFWCIFLKTGRTRK